MTSFKNKASVDGAMNDFEHSIDSKMGQLGRTAHEFHQNRAVAFKLDMKKVGENKL